MEFSEKPLQEKLSYALQQRSQLIQPGVDIALRLFNGFLEGDSRWVIELFGKTLVINDHLDGEEPDLQIIQEIGGLYREWLPDLKTCLHKHRYSSQLEYKRGRIIFGDQLTKEICETGVQYAINLTINQDSSFYLDTRYLRTWLLENMNEKTVLNTFAYTGSLGVAALAGGARHIMQVDLNRRFLDVSKVSCQLNDIPLDRMRFMVGDFYRAVGNLKQNNCLFDCVILDPPFFSATEAGRIDLVNQNARLINKVKPLVAHQGYLIVVNNALFLSGQDFIEMVEELCKDQYMKIDTIIPVPQDVIGFNETIVSQPPTPVAPFNHSTKIVVLQVKRKDNKSAS